MSNIDIVEKMKRHHASLSAGLQAHVDLLADQAAAGEDHQAAVRAIQAFLSREIHPHAAAEEQVVYPLASRYQELRGLVDAMITEHRWLQTATKTLETAPDAVRAAGTAQAISTLFGLHAEKENVFILPALAADPDTDLEGVLARMHTALEAAQADPSQTGPDQTWADQAGRPAMDPDGVLDVRPLPPRRRHELVFSTFAALVPGQHFELVNDHDPKPLRYQLAAEHPDSFSWDYLEAGPSTWRVRIARTAA